MPQPPSRWIISLLLAALVIAGTHTPIAIQAKDHANRPMLFPTTQQAKLKSSPANASSFFGTAVALSADGNIAIVSATTEDSDGFDANGAIYFFTRAGTTWTQQQRIIPLDPGSSDLFGQSLALSANGDTLLVGVVGESTAPKTGNGAAYVFTRTLNTWTQQQKLTVTGSANNNDGFGISVDLSSDGNTAIIGASREDGAPGANSGAAYVFTRTSGTWTEQQRLVSADLGANDRFGVSVALSSDGNLALVGASIADAGATTDVGAGYIFTRTSGTWTQQAKLIASDAVTIDRLGISAALSADGTTALLGADEDDTGATGNHGSAYVFVQNGGVTSWIQQQKLNAADLAAGDTFGGVLSLSANGDTALIGARNEDTTPNSENGAAYTFTRTSGVWTQQQKLFAGDISSSLLFGSATALSSDGYTAMIGALSDDVTLNNSGAAYVFIGIPPATSTSSPTTAASATATRTSTFTATATATTPPTLTATPSATSTSTTAATATFTATATSTFTATSTTTFTPTFTATSTFTPTFTHTFTPTFTPTLTPSRTNTPPPPISDTIGVFKEGQWYLRLSNSTGLADLTTFFGQSTDLPVVGDWDGNGFDTIGLYRSTEGRFLLSDSNTVPSIAYDFSFGNPGDTPIAGKWDAMTTGSGVGVYRGSNGVLYLKRAKSSGFDDYHIIFGNPGDSGIAGDWNGDGFDNIGVYRPATTQWLLSNVNLSGIRNSDIDFVWGTGSHAIVVGDWDGNSTSTPGYLTNTGNFVLHPANVASGVDTIFPYGPVNSLPVAGKWTTFAQPPGLGVIQPVGINPVTGGENGAD